MGRTLSKTRVGTPEVQPPALDTNAMVKKLLSDIPPRAREVLTCRFGLGTSSTRETLEDIGDRWSITRERVRQIESTGLEAVRGSKAFKSVEPQLLALEKHIESLGAILPENMLLAHLAKDEKTKNRYRFLLVVGSSFFRERETDEFYARWHIDEKTASIVHDALSRLYARLPDNEVVAEADILNQFLEELKEVNTAYRNEEVLKRWLSLSKNISANPLSEWGKMHVPGIKTKGIRDFAYLVIKQNKEPMHFADVAKSIFSLFSKKAHVATTHNELIKDNRFVLVGRGLYALSEWGYEPGVVRDVIKKVLKEKGPMTKEKIIEEVKKVRYVKDNTILVNLNDTKYFTRAKDGTYSSVR